MTGSTCLFLLLTCCGGDCPCDSTSASETASLGRAYSTASWHVQESEHFHVCVRSTPAEAAEVARTCETLLDDLQHEWFDGGEPIRWRPRCQVIVHATRQDYLAVVGPDGGATVGSTLVERRGGQIAGRRIDLCAASRDGALAPLAHELTHVLLADRFGAMEVPRWADEGLAVLADPIGKQQRHYRDFLAAADRDALLRLPELFSEADSQWAARPQIFYGQSVALVKYLAERGTREQLLTFLTLAVDLGYDAALEDVYDIDGVAALERLWHSEVVAARRGPSVQSLVDDDPAMKVGRKRS